MGTISGIQQSNGNWIQRSQMAQLPGNPTLLTSSYDPNLHAQKYQINSQLLNSQFEIYQCRRIPHKNIVNIYEVAQKCDIYNCVPLLATSTVITERIPYRLAMLEKQGISQEQGLYILKQALNGYYQIYKRRETFTCQPTAKTIGIMNNGQVKVWINENWAKNSPKTLSEPRMINQLINVVEDYITNYQGDSKIGFSPSIRKRINNRGYTFTEMQQTLRIICSVQLQVRAKERLVANVVTFVKRKAGFQRYNLARQGTLKMAKEQGQQQVTKISNVEVQQPQLRFSNEKDSVSTDCLLRKQGKCQLFELSQRGFIINRHHNVRQQPYQWRQKARPSKLVKTARPFSEDFICYSEERVSKRQSLRKTDRSNLSVIFKPLPTNSKKQNIIEPKIIKARCMKSDRPSNLVTQRTIVNPINFSDHRSRKDKISKHISAHTNEAQKLIRSNKFQRRLTVELSNLSAQTSKYNRNDGIPSFLVKKQSQSTVSINTNPKTVTNTPKDSQPKACPLTPVRFTCAAFEQHNSRQLDRNFIPVSVYFKSPNSVPKHPIRLQEKAIRQRVTFEMHQNAQIVKNQNCNTQQGDLSQTPSNKPQKQSQDKPRSNQTAKFEDFYPQESLQIVSPALENDFENTQRFASTFKYYLQHYGTDLVASRQTTMENITSSRSCIKFEQDSSSDTMNDQENLEIEDIPPERTLDRKEDTLTNRNSNQKCQLPIIEQGSQFQY